MAEKRVKVGRTDIEIAVAVGICLLVAKVIPHFQIMTACIAVLLCVQDNVKVSFKAGVTRLIITAIGGIIGILVILLDEWLANQWLLIGLTMLGIVLTLGGCKLAGVPYISARIGGVTFVLVVLTKTGTERFLYAVFRFLSTFYGAVSVLAVTALFSFLIKDSRMERNGNLGNQIHKN